MRTQHRSPSLPHFSYTPLAAAVALALAPQAAQAAGAGCTSGTTICVNSPGDNNPTGGGVFNPYGGEIDLRGAINACSGGTIRFDLTDTAFNPSGGAFVIKPSAPLPGLNCAVDGEGHSTDTSSRVTVDGTNAGNTDGLSGNTSVLVQGMNVTNFAYGAAIGGNVQANDNIASNSLKGIQATLDVTNNRVHDNSYGIYSLFSNQTISGNTVYANDIGIEANDVSPTITGNTIGLGPTGATGNATGVDIAFGSPTVSSNVISNNDIGISILEDSGATIDSNLIGTDASGSVLKANQVGIATSFSYGTSITGNTIAAPLTGTAIDIEDDSQDVSVGDNLINTNSNGDALLGGGEGIVAGCSSNLSVSFNTIATNGRNAIDFGAMFNSSIGQNRIGTNGLFGGTQLGAVLNGISLHDATCNLGADLKVARAKFLSATPTDTTDVSSNTIVNASANGIILDGAVNTNIAGENSVTGSALYGVEILAGNGNHIVENFIYGNGVTLGAGAKNIDLDFHGGPLPNDAGDTDSGANDGQNYPSNIAVHYHPDLNETEITFNLDSVAGTYRIDVYENSPPTTVPGGLPASFGNTFVTVPGGPYSYWLGGQHSSISLTATSLDGSGNLFDTSEFSPVQNTVLGPNATVTPTVVDFGTVPVGSSSGPRVVTVQSTGTDTYTMHNYGDSTCYGGPICYGGAFTCTSTCSEGFTDYAPHTGCSFSVTFNPTFSGSFSQTIQICDNTTTHIRNISLLGSAVVPPPITFDPPEFNFGSIAIGQTTPPEVFTVTNQANVTVDIGAPSVSGDYAIGTTTCFNNLNPNESCTVAVNFTPTSTGERDGVLSMDAAEPAPALKQLAITHGARFVKPSAVLVNGPKTSTATAALTGTGVVAGALVLPSSVDFGAYAIGSDPITRTVTLHNTGNAPVKITTISIDGPFTMTNDCPASLAVGQSCTITLTFSGTQLGNFTGGLTVVTDAPGGSGTIQVTASVVAPAQPTLEVTPKTIGFGSRMIGTSQGTQRITIKNIGAAPAVLGALAFDGVDFTLGGNTCGPTLAPGSTCFADVQFMPLGFGLRHEHFIVNSNAVNNPVSVDLAGTGCRPFSITGGASSCS
jgi:parallel beta-helix repeat protein